MDCTKCAVPVDFGAASVVAVVGLYSSVGPHGDAAPVAVAAVRAAVAAPVVDTPEDVDAMDAFLATLK